MGNCKFGLGFIRAFKTNATTAILEILEGLVYVSIPSLLLSQGVVGSLVRGWEPEVTGTMNPAPTGCHTSACFGP